MAKPTLDDYNKAITEQQNRRGTWGVDPPLAYGHDSIESGSAAAILWETLISSGIECRIGGCGCCGSPFIDVVVGGKTLSDDDANMSTVLADIYWNPEEATNDD